MKRKRAEIRQENLFYKENISIFNDHIDLCTNTLSQVSTEFPSLKDKVLRCFEGRSSMENRVLSLSSLLEKMYNIKEDRSLLKKLVIMSKECELVDHLNPILFWFLHLLGTINYCDYIVLINLTSFVSFMSSMMSGTNTTDKNTIVMRKYDKKYSITSEILLYLLDNRQFDPIHAIVYLDRSSNLEHSQSDIFTSNIHPKPYTLDTMKLTILLDIASVLQKHDSCDLLEEWKCQNANRLLSCIITTATSGRSNCKDVVMRVIDMLTPAILVKEIEKELRSSTDSVFDFTFMIWLKKQIELTKESFLFLYFEQPNSMRKIGTLANNIAFDGVSEENTPLWLRSLFLVEQMSLFSDFLNLAHTSDNIPGNTRFNDWIDVILGPKSSFLNPDASPGVRRSLESDQLYCVVYNQRNIAFICCASLEIIDKLSDNSLKVLCNQLRARHQLNKESIDVFINSSRSRIQQLGRARASLIDNTDGGEGRTLPEIDVHRVKAWWDTLQRTKSLPATISQTIKMNGGKGGRMLLYTLKVLVLQDPSVKRMCCELVSAMATSSPPLCSEQMVNNFMQNEKDVEFMLESLSLPPLVLKQVTGVIKYTQQMQVLMSKYCLNDNKSTSDSGELMDASTAQLLHQQRTECFDRWKQSVKLSLVSDDMQVNIKVATVIITSAVQSVTLLSKLVHEYSSYSRDRPGCFSMYSFLNHWSDWFKDIFDVIGEHDLIISSIVGIMLSKEGVIGYHPSTVDGSIANSSSIGLVFSLLTVPVQMKLLNNLFLRHNPSTNGVMNSNILLLKVLGYMFYSLSWSMCLLCCRGSDISMQVENVLGILQGCANPCRFSPQYNHYLRLAATKSSLVSCVFIWLYYYLQETPNKCFTAEISYMYQNCTEQSDCHRANINIAKVVGDPALSMILEWEMTYFCNLFSMISISQRTACYYKLYGMLCLGDTSESHCTHISVEVAHQLWNAVTNLLCGIVEKTNLFRPGEYGTSISGTSKNLVACVVNSLVSHIKMTFLSQLDNSKSFSVISAQKNAMQIIVKTWMKSCKHAIAFDFSLVTVSALMVLVAKELLISCASEDSTIDCTKWFLWLVHGNHAITHNLSLDFRHTIEILTRNCIPVTSFPLCHVHDALKIITSSNGIMPPDIATMSMQVAPNVDINKWDGCNTLVILNDCINVALMLCRHSDVNLVFDSLKNAFTETSIFPPHHTQWYVRMVGWVLATIILLQIKNVAEIKAKLPILLKYFDRVFITADKDRVFSKNLTLSMTSSCMLIASTESLFLSVFPWVKSNSIIMLGLLISHAHAQYDSLTAALRQELESQLPVDIVDDMIAGLNDSLNK